MSSNLFDAGTGAFSSFTFLSYSVLIKSQHTTIKSQHTTIYCDNLQNHTWIKKKSNILHQKTMLTSLPRKHQSQISNKKKRHVLRKPGKRCSCNKIFSNGGGGGWQTGIESKWAMQNFDILKFKWEKLYTVKVKDH